MHTSPEVLALLALGEDAATPAERAHAVSCPICSQEVAELAGIADVGRTTSASDSMLAPDPRVWERIRAEIGFTGASATSTAVLDAPPQAANGASVTDLSARRDGATTTDPPRRSSAGRRLVSLAVAAGLALVAGIGIGIGYERQVVRPENRVIARAQLQPLPQWPGASGTAEVTADGRGNRKLIVRMTSPKPVDGETQVWLIDAKTGQPSSMGTVKNGVGDLNIPKDMSLFERPLVDISDEPPDQNPAHSGDSIVRGQLV